MRPTVTLIRDADLYAPAPQGRSDILIVGETIMRVDANLSGVLGVRELGEINVIDAAGKIVAPGMLDQHVHIAGGGGAAGYGSRGPEIRFSECMLAGTTTVVGCLGIDTITRSPFDLVAKARSLHFRGMSAFAYSGGFDIPPRLITDSVKRDIWLVPEIIGIGESAVSDFRARHQSASELAQLFTDVLVSGRMTGKAGVVHIHLGPNPGGMQPVFDAIDLACIPVQYILPTHFNRTDELMKHAREWADRGGYVDVSSNLDPEFYPGSTQAAAAVAQLVEDGVPVSRITLSTDGNGVHTLYGYDTMHRFPLSMLHRDLVTMVHGHQFPLSDALSVVTENVAMATGLSSKGRITEGADADLMFLDPTTLSIDLVMARGVVHVENAEFIARHSFDV